MSQDNNPEVCLASNNFVSGNDFSEFIKLFDHLSAIQCHHYLKFNFAKTVRNKSENQGEYENWNGSIFNKTFRGKTPGL